MNDFMSDNYCPISNENHSRAGDKNNILSYIIECASVLHKDACFFGLYWNLEHCAMVKYSKQLIAMPQNTRLLGASPLDRNM